jgi:hypothetical protein
VILGHELGHIMSGHPTYTTLALIILNIGFSNIPVLGLITLPIQLALLEWYRKAELSADRAGLLATQDPRASMSTFLKMAGGGAGDDEISLDAFMEQARSYETQADLADKVWQVINTAFRTHPFGAVRAAELQKWVESGEYGRIIGGDYRRRDDAATPPLSDDFVDAAGYYGDQAKSAMDTISGVLGRARDAFSDAFKTTGTTGSSETK